MMNQKGKPTVCVEDLLRLKRAERPRAEFWTEFDRELRAKQLAALVEKRPWWSALPRRLRGLARYQLPLGATAVLAITLVSLRDYQPLIRASKTNHVEVVAPAIAAAARSVQQEDSAPLINEIATTSNGGADNATGDRANSRVGVSDAPAAARLVPVIQTRAEFAMNVEEERPSARSIAENRAVAEAMLGTTDAGFDNRVMPVKMVTQEPLAKISNPSDARRSRFAMAFAAAAVGTSPVPTARVASRLSDEQLYDTIHRFGASGNSVSFKF